MTFAGKSVLVTGAGGSIGSQLCAKVAADGARRLTMVSLTEGSLYTADKTLRGQYSGTEFVPVVGSVGNDCLIRQALEGVEVVIHAAAHKHVPLCEKNPVEAIRNNVFGTETLAWAAAEQGARQFCLISSDKAVQPASIMGATKRLAEMIVAQMGQVNDCSFFSVRFGNVMDSAGSVLPLWREQIKAGGPLTLTDERCERYFMSIPDAVGLIASVIGIKPKSGTFVLDMGRPRRLADMARELMQEMGQVVPIKMTGLRPGEKLTEELFHGGSLIPTPVKGVSQVNEQARFLESEHLTALDKACDVCDEQKAKALLWSMVS